MKFFMCILIVAMTWTVGYSQAADTNQSVDTAQVISGLFQKVDNALADSNYKVAAQILLDSLIFKFQLEIERLPEAQQKTFVDVADGLGRPRFVIMLNARLLKMCLENGDHLGAMLFYDKSLLLMLENNIDMDKEFPEWKEYGDRVRKLAGDHFGP